MIPDSGTCGTQLCSFVSGVLSVRLVVVLLTQVVMKWTSRISSPSEMRQISGNPIMRKHAPSAMFGVEDLKNLFGLALAMAPQM